MKPNNFIFPSRVDEISNDCLLSALRAQSCLVGTEKCMKSQLSTHNIRWKCKIQLLCWNFSKILKASRIFHPKEFEWSQKCAYYHITTQFESWKSTKDQVTVSLRCLSFYALVYHQILASSVQKGRKNGWQLTVSHETKMSQRYTTGYHHLSAICAYHQAIYQGLIHRAIYQGITIISRHHYIHFSKS